MRQTLQLLRGYSLSQWSERPSSIILRFNKGFYSHDLISSLDHALSKRALDVIFAWKQFLIFSIISICRTWEFSKQSGPGSFLLNNPSLNLFLSFKIFLEAARSMQSVPSTHCLQKAWGWSLCSLGIAYIIPIPVGQSAAKLSISTNHYPFPPMSMKIIFNFLKPSHWPTY